VIIGVDAFVILTVVPFVTIVPVVIFPSVALSDMFCATTVLNPNSIATANTKLQINNEIGNEIDIFINVQLQKQSLRLFCIR
jgi:hypothetical protein